MSPADERAALAGVAEARAACAVRLLNEDATGVSHGVLLPDEPASDDAVAVHMSGEAVLVDAPAVAAHQPAAKGAAGMTKAHDTLSPMPNPCVRVRAMVVV